MVDTSEASAAVAGAGDRIRTSGDSEVSTYLEIAEAREPGHLLTPAPEAPEAIVVLDYGSQFSMLITRRIREAGVYAELAPWNTPSEKLSHLKVRGFVLSGGPASVYDEGAPTLPPYVVASGLPVLGICYGMQLLAQSLGGRVAPASRREYGHAVITLSEPAHGLLHDLPATMPVWMSHSDRIVELPPGFRSVAYSDDSPIAAMSNDAGCLGIQFHPEVVHTPQGSQLLRNFLFGVAGCSGDWTAANFIEESIRTTREQVGDGQVICALSGGVDSAVAATLVHAAVGDQLTCIFVDNGLLRKGEREGVERTFRRHMGMELLVADAREEFLDGLAGVDDPERKRGIIGEVFIRVFERTAREAGKDASLLVQGTLYPDVIESLSVRGPSATIKTHHNVGGLPDDMPFELIEPLRELFKDEVRRVGRELGLSEAFVARHPFPGPGLAVRILGEVTWERLEVLREADAIFLEEIRAAGLYDEIWQAFAVLLPVRSVGVMGDARTYECAVTLRAVTSRDGMTADWYRFPPDVLARASTRVINEVAGVNRVAYDISSKPPATIEWE